MKEKKYELTDEEIEFNGHTLYRIIALKDFGRVKKGDLGGFIEKEDNLSHEGNCWIGDEVKVFGNARVYENAEVTDNALVFGNAKVYGVAEVYEYASVYGSAKVYENAEVWGNTQVYGNAEIKGFAKVEGVARVYDDALVFGNARVYGYAKIIGSAEVGGNAEISEGEISRGTIYERERKYELTDETVEQDGHILHRIRALKDFGNVKKGDLGGFVESEDNLSHKRNCWVYGDAKVYENAKVCGNARVLGEAEVTGKVSGGRTDGSEKKDIELN